MGGWLVVYLRLGFDLDIVFGWFSYVKSWDNDTYDTNNQNIPAHHKNKKTFSFGIQMVVYIYLQMTQSKKNSKPKPLNAQIWEKDTQTLFTLEYTVT